MKTRNEELEEMIDLAIKSIWTYTIFRTLFRKEDADCEVRREHPEFFLAMHDSLLCSFCVAVEILFEENAKATSLWSLVRQAERQLSNKLETRIQAHKSSIKDIETLRHQVCAHRWQTKSPQKVLAEVKLRINAMTEIAQLTRFVILELAEDIDSKRKVELEKQQLSESTLGCVAKDALKVLQAFRGGEGSARGT